MKFNLTVFIAVIALLFNRSLVFGQTSEAKFKYDNKLYNALWSKQCELAKGKGLFNICLRSVTFARFIVKADGHIDSLDIYENTGTPPLLHETLTNFIKSTDGMWSPRLVNGKSINSRPIILPFVYQLESCGAKVVGQSTNETLLMFMNKFHDSNNPDQLNCVFLKPVTVFAQN